MSLRTKYLLVLNGIILSMWTVYAAWSLHKTEEQFMQAEVNSLRHLAVGLGLLVEHHLAGHHSVDGLQSEIESLLPNKEGLDIMLIDKSYTVRLATQRDRVGGKWFEKQIEQVFKGVAETMVIDKEHFHMGRRAIDVSAAVRDPSGKIALVVHVARWLDHLSGALNTQLISHGLFALAILIVVGVAINLLTYSIVLKPLSHMNEELGESGWISSHPELKSGNEIEKVHAALHDAMGRINRHTSDLEERLKRSERLAVIGQTGAALAHEIRNPLHVVRGAAETLLRQSPESAEFVGDIREEVDRVERLIGQVLDYTRESNLQLEKVEANELMTSVRDRVVKSIQAQHGERPDPNINIEHTDLSFVADPIMLEQALTNLLLNAVEATSNNAKIDIKVSTREDDKIAFEVLDPGTGIAVTDLKRAVEPFFTRKSRGTGLGLAVVEKIADLHDGEIKLSIRPEGGTRAELTIPRKNKG